MSVSWRTLAFTSDLMFMENPDNSSDWFVCRSTATQTIVIPASAGVASVQPSLREAICFRRGLDRLVRRLAY